MLYKFTRIVTQGTFYLKSRINLSNSVTLQYYSRVCYYKFLNLVQGYSSVEQYTGYVVIPQYYFPVPSNFFDTAVPLSTDIVQYSSLKMLFSTKMRFIYISKTFELV